MEPTWFEERLFGVMTLVLVALTVTGLSLAGCSSDKSDSTESAALGEHVGTYEATGDGGDAALLEGTVRLLDSCFTVEQRGVRDGFLPLFPDDEVAWSGGRLDYDGKTYGEGDAIALGGGESGIVDGATIPDDCNTASGLRPWTVTQQG